MLASLHDAISNDLRNDFAKIFGPAPRIIFYDAAMAAPEQRLDPASQTGDFVLPDDKPQSPIRQALREVEEISAIADRIGTGTDTMADRERLTELSSAISPLAFVAAESWEPINPDIDDEDSVDVFDLRHEEVRVYHFPNGDNVTIEVEVDNPVEMTIGPAGSHQITPHDRVGVIVPVGWIKCEVFPKVGGACFPGHISVNDIA